MGDIEEQIRAFVRSNFYVGNRSLDPEESLIDQGIVDSTGVLELIGFLEETYGITIADEEVVPENLDSIGRIARYLARKQAESPQVALG